MTDLGDFPDLGLEIHGHVVSVELRRPPHNFFDIDVVRTLADAFEAIDRDDRYRAIVLCAQGKSFCAGANFGDGSGDRLMRDRRTRDLYREAVRLFSCRKPVVAAVNGPAVGGGLGLALVADFRVACPEARFAANFTRLGIHPGFGLTVTLPRVIGQQRAAMMFYTSRRLKAEEALDIGLADMVVPLDRLRATAIELAAEIASNAPLAVESTRATMRMDLARQIAERTDHESDEQAQLRETEDFAEGIKATAERRVPAFHRR
ncbi:Enoyl-CoA hydratase/isomerase [alpha proteobacterium BAL199]|jgi:enoyl-CoA hydratase/carnithine racemase|nr:Enoyl-CoA hydratase/isomerase [alpha proteobacterium BAL199]